MEEEVTGATVKRSLGVRGADFKDTPKRVWRWHPFSDDGAVAENVSV